MFVCIKLVAAIALLNYDAQKRWKNMKLLKILSLSLLLHAGAFASSEGIARRPLHVPEDPSAVIQNEDRVALLEREVQALLGRVEVLEHTVSQLSSGQAAATPATPRAQAAVSDEIEAHVAHQLPSPTVAATSSAEVTPPASAGSPEKKAYDTALLALKDNKFDDAEARFADFIAKYPKSTLLSNAYFWHGETFFRRNNFEKAAISYLKGYKQFPKAAKAADSLLKLSLSLGSMGKTKEACAMLVKLEAEFKDRPANSIKRAKDARSKYGCSK